jgi:hypothetical protein
MNLKQFRACYDRLFFHSVRDARAFAELHEAADDMLRQGYQLRREAWRIYHERFPKDETR